jgi:hypothetical protein
MNQQANYSELLVQLTRWLFYERNHASEGQWLNDRNDAERMIEENRLPESFQKQWSACVEVGA